MTAKTLWCLSQKIEQVIGKTIFQSILKLDTGMSTWTETSLSFCFIYKMGLNDLKFLIIVMMMYLSYAKNYAIENLTR